MQTVLFFQISEYRFCFLDELLLMHRCLQTANVKCLQFLYQIGLYKHWLTLILMIELNFQLCFSVSAPSFLPNQSEFSEDDEPVYVPRTSPNATFVTRLKENATKAAKNVARRSHDLYDTIRLKFCILLTIVIRKVN